MAELSTAAGVDLGFVREMSTGAQVLSLPQSIPLGDVEAIARRITAGPGVEYAEPDVRMYPLLTPNDPQFANQWHLTDFLGGINAPAAWDITSGIANTVVAVLDTGYTLHPDLDGRLLPGYDFIVDPAISNDGDGRDADSSDPGDWVTDAEKTASKLTDCKVRNSSWHGTQVAVKKLRRNCRHFPTPRSNPRHLVRQTAVERDTIGMSDGY